MKLFSTISLFLAFFWCLSCRRVAPLFCWEIDKLHLLPLGETTNEDVLGKVSHVYLLYNACGSCLMSFKEELKRDTVNNKRLVFVLGKDWPMVENFIMNDSFLSIVCTLFRVKNESYFWNLSPSLDREKLQKLLLNNSGCVEEIVEITN